MKIGSGFLTAMAVYALVVSLLWIFLTEVMFVSDFTAFTGQTLANALASGSKPAELWLITKRLLGVELFSVSLLMLLIAQKSYKRGEKWSWYALLISGIRTWGSLIGYIFTIGYYQGTLGSFVFTIGTILFVIGIALPAKTILGKSSLAEQE